MSTLEPAGGLTCCTLSRRNAGPVHCSRGGAGAFAATTVGAAVAEDQDTDMEKRSWVKETFEPGPILRAHPSGWITLKEAPFGAYVGYWMVSGISPGGLLSMGTGGSMGAGLSFAHAEDGEGEPGELVELLAAGGVDEELLAVGDEFEHAARAAQATNARANARSCFVFGRML